MNLKRIENKVAVARTLTARDYKGFGSGYQLQNGVIQWTE